MHIENLTYKMSRSVLVVFLGPMGSGKSTQIKLLNNELRTNSIPTRIPHFKTGVLIGPIIKLLLVNVINKNEPYKPPLIQLMEKKPGVFRKTFGLFLTLDVIYVVLNFLFKIYLPYKFRHFIIVEDYIHNLLLDYEYILRSTEFSTQLSLNVYVLLRLLYSINERHVIFLDANLESLKTRHINRRDEYENMRYILMQRSILKNIAYKTTPKKSIIYIKTDEVSIEETHNIIMKYITNYI